uniref:Copper transport protein ATOX1 n=1 Tax=Parastrongyloides trichosuri TaxID=131310 RepID=A0A0N4ZV88_PARTI
MPKTYVFEMGMTCDGCANAAKKVLSKLGDKVICIDADVATKTIKVTTSLESSEIQTQLEKTGKSIKLLK